MNIAFHGEKEKDRNPCLVDIGLKIFNNISDDQHAIRNIALILSSDPTLKKWQYFNDILVRGAENSLESVRLVDKLMRQLTFYSLLPFDYKFNDQVELLQLWEVQNDFNEGKRTFDEFFQ